MPSVPPKLRKDLTVSQQLTAEGKFFVVKDPVTGDFFRFGESERFIAEQFDGDTPVEAIRQRAEEEFGAALTPETLDRFITNLEKVGLLENGGTGQKRRTAQRRRRIRGSLLYLRFKLIDPDRFLGWLVRKARFFFTPYFLTMSAALILLAAGITIAHWNELTRDLPRLLRLSAIPLFLAVIFLVISAHEFAHGLTCKHFGGQVHEIGFLLIYFQPAMYCNVSDAWLFPEKSKRLWVGFAGPYFELFLWAVATLLWRLTNVETWVNYVALIVMTSSGFKTLLNFNPLIKLDGYYLLSDYLEIPNLRKRSFRYLGNRVRRLIGAVAPSAEEITPRERRAYLAYGLPATLFSFGLLSLLAWTIGGFLIARNEPAGLALFTGLLGVKFRRRLRKLFGRSGDRTDSSDDTDDWDSSDKAREPTYPSEPPASRNKKRRRWNRFKRAGKALVLVGTAGAIMFLGRMELRIAGEFNVRPIENADVRAEIEGIIEKIYVDEGDEIHAGDLIARLSDRDLQAELRKTEALILQTRAKLKLLEAGPTPQEVQVAKAAVARSEDRLKYAQSRLARDKNLFEQNLLSRKEFEDTQELATTAENDRAEAQGKLEVLISGSRPEEIDATKAEVDRMETQHRYLEEQLHLLKVVTPASGVVSTPSRQLKELVHQVVKKGDLIAKVYDLKTIKAEILISEKEIADIKPGCKVVLKARAYPDLTFHGTVTSIATTVQGISNPGVQSPYVSSQSALTRASILVTTEIDNPSGLLKPDMTGQAKISCGERRIFDLVTRRLARTVKVEFWSWW